MFNLILRCVGLISTIFFFTAINSCSAQPIIRLKKHSEGYTEPVGIAIIKDDASRFFVMERGGLIKIVSKNGKTTNATPFLDISSLLGKCEGYCKERGLLGVAFHPEYASTRKFFINYTQENSERELFTIVSQFRVDASEPDVAISDSETILLKFAQPYSNHNGGDIQFGPDGYLYVASGDGGSGGDPEENGQNRSTMLGKILRIDVDKTSSGQSYAIPPDNPFVSDSSTLDEIWAYGLRNPWRISFDTKEGDLFIADVGQNKWEEVNFQLSSSGGGQNYGWNNYEGTHCFKNECNPNDASFTFPILEYEHTDDACSITGGYVDRSKSNFMNGRYFYGDYCNGNIWSAKLVDDNWEVEDVMNGSKLSISSFGQDTDGNVYVINLLGDIYRLVKCKDSKKFQLTSNGKKCKWIKKEEDRITKWCSKKKVKMACRQTCDNCGA